MFTTFQEKECLAIEFFLKYFKYKNNIDRKRFSQLISIIGALTNAIIFVSKLTIGIILGSIAILADSFNNLSDVFTNVLVILGIKLSVKPADKEHPFGHGRGEYLVTLIIACFMIFLGFEFFRISILTIINPSPISFNIWLVAILVVTALIKLWMHFFYKEASKVINSKPLNTLAVDSLNDVFITTFTILSIIFTFFTGIIIDGFVSLIVSVIILYSGYKIAQETISKLLGESIDSETASKIQSMVESYENIIGSHDLIVHNYGPSSSMATLHVDMPNTLMLNQVHEIIDNIERKVKAELGIKLLLHVDPISVEDKRIVEIKERVFNYINKIDKNIDAQDFRIIEGDTIDVIFELVLPHGYNKDKEQLILISIETIIKFLNKDYNPIIEREYRYVNSD